MTIDHRKLVALTTENTPYTEFITSTDGYQVTDTVTRYTKSVYLIGAPPPVDPVAALDLNFANSLSLTDSVSGNNLVTFTRASTGTYVDASGVIQTASADAPRFDHDPSTGESLGLLIEESRTNYIKNYSNYFTTEQNCTIASGLSPASDNTAQVVTATVAGHAQIKSRGGKQPSTIPVNSTGINCSLYVKGSYSSFRLNIWAGTFAKQQVTFENFNTDSWTVSANTSDRPSSNYKVQNAGNGWYRLSFYASDYTVGNTVGLFCRGSNLSAGETYSVWMPQIEIGSFPTSAIPTGVSSEVTRAADVVKLSGTNVTDWYNDAEGTFFYERTKVNTVDNQQEIWIYPGPSFSQSNNSTPVWKTDGTTQLQTKTNNVSQPSSTVSSHAYKVALALKDNDTVLAVGGVVGNAVTGNTLPSPIDSIDLRYGSTYKSISYYPSRLTDQQLIALTS